MLESVGIQWGRWSSAKICTEVMACGLWCFDSSLCASCPKDYSAAAFDTVRYVQSTMEIQSCKETALLS
jgi:hypothetical protein